MLHSKDEETYSLNLSILVSGGKEANWDPQSSGERNGGCPSTNPLRMSRVEICRPLLLSRCRFIMLFGKSLHWRRNTCYEAFGDWDDAFGVVLFGCRALNGGFFHRRLNMHKWAIVKKYHEGKLKSTSKGGLKGSENVEVEVSWLCVLRNTLALLQRKMYYDWIRNTLWKKEMFVYSCRR